MDGEGTKEVRSQGRADAARRRCCSGKKTERKDYSKRNKYVVIQMQIAKLTINLLRRKFVNNNSLLKHFFDW